VIVPCTRNRILSDWRPRPPFSLTHEFAVLLFRNTFTLTVC
jgi:hypothetical protein